MCVVFELLLIRLYVVFYQTLWFQQTLENEQTDVYPILTGLKNNNINMHLISSLEMFVFVLKPL